MDGTVDAWIQSNAVNERDDAPTFTFFYVSVRSRVGESATRIAFEILLLESDDVINFLTKLASRRKMQDRSKENLDTSIIKTAEV